MKQESVAKEQHLPLSPPLSYHCHCVSHNISCIFYSRQKSIENMQKKSRHDAGEKIQMAPEIYMAATKEEVTERAGLDMA